MSRNLRFDGYEQAIRGSNRLSRFEGLGLATRERPGKFRVAFTPIYRVSV